VSPESPLTRATPLDLRALRASVDALTLHLVALRGALQVAELEPIRLIVGTVAAGMGVSTMEILGRRRVPAVAQARQISMMLAGDLLDWSSVQVGAAFNRDHGTVLHARTAVFDQMEVDLRFRSLVDGFRAALAPHFQKGTPCSSSSS
jgi:chromosomal replication initiation ATPase DnaA